MSYKHHVMLGTDGQVSMMSATTLILSKTHNTMSSSKTQKNIQTANKTPQIKTQTAASRILIARSSSKDDDDVSGCESVNLVPKLPAHIKRRKSQEEETSEEETTEDASEGLTDELSKDASQHAMLHSKTPTRRRKAQLLSVRKRQIRSPSGDDTQLSRETDELDRSQEFHSDPEEFEEADQHEQSQDSHEDADDESEQSEQSRNTEDWTGTEQLELQDDPIESQAAEAASQAFLQIQPTPQAVAPLTRIQIASFGINTYVAALQKGYGALCEVLYNSMSRRKAMKQLSEETFRDVGTHVLASIPTPILREIISDSLAYAHLGSKTPDLVSVVQLHQMPMALGNVPCIYQIALADNQGRGLLKADLLTILHWASVYAKIDSKNNNDIDAAYDIDRHGHPQNKREAAVYGVRRYMPPHVEPAKTATAKAVNKQRRYDIKMGLLSKRERYVLKRPSATKISTVADFLQLLGVHASTMQSNDRLLLKYVGYAASATKRWHSHQSGNNSNYLMGLFKAICAVKLASKGYDLRKYMIVTLAEPEEAPVAELIVAELSNSYYDSGHGFNIAGAGESTSSFDALTEQAKANAREWIRKCSPREANYDLQIQAFQARQHARSLKNVRLDVEIAHCELLLLEQEQLQRENETEVLSAILEDEISRMDKVNGIMKRFTGG